MPGKSVPSLEFKKMVKVKVTSKEFKLHSRLISSRCLIIIFFKARSAI